MEADYPVNPQSSVKVEISRMKKKRKRMKRQPTERNRPHWFRYLSAATSTRIDQKTKKKKQKKKKARK